MKANKNIPVLYNTFIIYTNNKSGLLSAYSYMYDIHINPLYKTWGQLKSIIDNIKVNNFKK